MCKITDYTSSLSNKWITLVIGCLNSIATGPSYAIAACTKDIMSTFDMTENQYGLIATMYMTGNLLLFLPGILLDQYGPIPVSVISLILTLLSYGSIWQLAKYQPFSGEEYLLYVAFFCAGLSVAGQGSVAVAINLGNFQTSAHGKVSGLLGFSIFVGGTIFTQLYTNLLSPNLSDFFLMVTFYSATVCILMILFARRFPEGNGYSNMESEETPEGTVSGEGRNNALNPLKSPELYIILIVCIFTVSGAHVLLFMTDLYAESLGLGKHSSGLLTMSTVVTAVSVLMVGIISDFMLAKIPRMFVAFIITTAQTLALFIGLFQIEHLQALIFLMLTNSVMFAVFDTLFFSELHEVFGDQHYGKILGTLTTTMGFATMGLEYFTTWFYEKERKKQESLDEWCHGKICVLPGLFTMFILSTIALVLTLTYLYRRKKADGNIQYTEDLECPESHVSQAYVSD